MEPKTINAETIKLSEEVKKTSLKEANGIAVTSEDAALGCVFGAFIGDAIGSRLEFKSSCSEQDVNDALLMEGGGSMGLGPGQVTDDSELAWSLAKGLIESGAILDLNKIVKYYGDWMNSSPFGIKIFL